MYTKTSPYFAKVKERELLSKPGSTKKTYHVVLSLETSAFAIKPGDSIAILPSNDPQEVEKILKIIKLDPNTTIFDRRKEHFCSLFAFLCESANLQKVTQTNFKRFLEKSENREMFAPYLEKHWALSEFLEKSTLLDVLEKLQPTLEAADFTFLQPLLPRFYSIANSIKVLPNEIHLLVRYVEYEQEGKLRKGVGSHFLCDLVKPDTTPVPIYLQPSMHFALPEDSSSDIIMIGPGTGIAPYRAFLQERVALNHTGKNWLFFGERHSQCDFYYESFLKELQEKKHLKLDLAFSRDTEEKTYVQHKIYKARKQIWNWIENGAYLYVCGDAKAMAKDVEKMLLKIFEKEGKLSEETARLFLKSLRLQKRYLLDVY